MEFIEVLVDDIPLKQYRAENGSFVTAVANKEYAISIVNTSEDYCYSLVIDGAQSAMCTCGEKDKIDMEFRINEKQIAALKFKKATISGDKDTPINVDDLGKIEAVIYRVKPAEDVNPVAEQTDSDYEAEIEGFNII